MQPSSQEMKGEDDASVNHFNRSLSSARMPLLDFLRRKRPSVHDTLSVVGLRSALLLGMLSNMGDSETDEVKEEPEGGGGGGGGGTQSMSEIKEENEADLEAANKEKEAEDKIETGRPTPPPSSGVMSPLTGNNVCNSASLNRDTISTTSSEESSAPRINPRLRKGSDSETERDRIVMPTVTINSRRESRDGKEIQENVGGLASKIKPTFAETMFGRNAPKIRARDLMNIPVTAPSVRTSNQKSVTSTANCQNSDENLSNSSPSIMTSITTNTSTSDEFSTPNSTASAKRVSFLKTQSMEETRYREFTEAARTLREEEYSSDGPKQHSRRIPSLSSPSAVMKKISMKKQQQNRMSERQRGPQNMQMNHPQFMNHNPNQHLPVGSNQVVHVHWNPQQPWMAPIPNQNFLTVPQQNFFHPYFDRGFNDMPSNNASINPPSFPNYYQMQFKQRHTSLRMRRQISLDYSAQAIPEEDWASGSPNSSELSLAHHDDRRQSRSASRTSKRSSMPIRKSMSLRLPAKSPPSPRSSSSQSPSPPPPPVSSEILSTNRRRAGNQSLNDSSSSTSSGSVKTAVKVSVAKRHEVTVEVNPTENSPKCDALSNNHIGEVSLDKKGDENGVTSTTENSISPKNSPSHTPFKACSNDSILLTSRCNDEEKIDSFGSRKMSYKVTQL